MRSKAVATEVTADMDNLYLFPGVSAAVGASPHLPADCKRRKNILSSAFCGRQTAAVTAAALAKAKSLLVFSRNRSGSWALTAFFPELGEQISG